MAVYKCRNQQLIALSLSDKGARQTILIVTRPQIEGHQSRIRNLLSTQITLSILNFLAKNIIFFPNLKREIRRKKKVISNSIQYFTFKKSKVSF